jgi:hypothetical protein
MSKVENSSSSSRNAGRSATRSAARSAASGNKTTPVAGKSAQNDVKKVQAPRDTLKKSSELKALEAGRARTSGHSVNFDSWGLHDSAPAADTGPKFDMAFGPRENFGKVVVDPKPASQPQFDIGPRMPADQFGKVVLDHNKPAQPRYDIGHMPPEDFGKIVLDRTW